MTSPRALGATDDGVARGIAVGDGHEVRHLGETRPVQGASQQNVRVREVQLLEGATVEARAEREVATGAVVEERGEHRRRIEVRVGEEVDRPVPSDERHGAQIADHAIVLDRLVVLARHRMRRARMKVTALASDVSVRMWFHTVHAVR
jgi:hypothetical protein